MKLSQLVRLLLQISLVGLVNSQQSNCTYPGKCGNVTIPYPFSTEEGCYLDESYYIECNSTTQIPRLNISPIHLLQERGLHSPLEILEVNLKGQLRVKLPIMYACYDNRGTLLNGSTKSFQLSRFPLGLQNKFVGVGCPIEASLKTEPSIITTCQTNCVFGIGSSIGPRFCRTDIPSRTMTYAQISIQPLLNYTTCGYAFIVDYNYWFNESDPKKINPFYPAVLAWSVGNTTCEEALKDKKTYKCKDNTVCENGESNFGYRCKCPKGFRGNAYIQNGCQDIDECEDPKLNNCQPGHCKNTHGSFTCVCPKGLQGNPKGGGECTPGGDETKLVIEGNDTNKTFSFDLIVRDTTLSSKGSLTSPCAYEVTRFIWCAKRY
ncbi:EGF-like domain-containing protein [Artemisia annua]|uniref:EGF-like domain-containing protein n=1 Tax=Artemisia annua TaxID=35608 RepID=A0A2U1P6K4_ARTAN|nr:EGF-like domain-containing protein [Artemisia annua]